MKQNRLPHLLRPENWILWVLFAVILRYIWFFIGAEGEFHIITYETFGVMWGDAKDYVDMSERVINGELYQLYNNPVYRMPGFLFIYLPFRLFFTKTATIFIIINLQIILSGIAIYLLAKLGYLLFKSRLFFYVTSAFLSLSYILMPYTRMLFLDSICSSLIIVFVWLLYRYKFNKANLLVCGAIATIIIFSRPYLYPLILLPLAYLLYQKVSFYKVKIKLIVLFLAPLVIAQTGWIIRNYMLLDRVFLLEDTINYAAMGTNCRTYKSNLIKCLGEDGQTWKPNTMALWLDYEEHITQQRFTRPPDSIIPTILFNGADLTMDQLKKARYYDNMYETSTDLALQKLYSDSASAIYIKFIDHIKTNHPYMYYVKSRLKHLFNYLYLVDSPFKKFYRYPVNVALVWGQATLGLLIMFVGLLGLFVIAIKELLLNKRFQTLYILSVPFWLLGIFILFFNDTEERHIIIGMPFFAVGTAYLINLIWEYKNAIMRYGMLAIMFAITAFYGWQHTLKAIKW
jgi:hypothetical protein